ncbi:hypothetical protein [Vibrio sp. 10N.261.51.F12]
MKNGLLIVCLAIAGVGADWYQLDGEAYKAFSLYLEFFYHTGLWK